MKIKKQSLSIIASIVLATSFIGCSGGGTGSNESVKSISGRVVDGYIKDATVCLDINNNSLCDTNEISVKTNSNGLYTLSLDSLTDAQRETVKIIAQGGIDTSSNLAFQGILKSPLTPEEVTINMNTLTTMAAERVVNNEQALQELKKVANSLGLKIEDITSDILESESKIAYREALKLQKSLEILSEALISTTEAERLENMKKIQAKLSEGFDGVSSDIDAILDGTTFENELAEVEKIKTRTRNLINATIINANETKEEIERKQLLLEKKRDAFVKEMNRIQIINGDIANDLDDTTLETHFNSIDSLYINENQEIIRIINLLELDEEVDTFDLADLVIIFKEAEVTAHDNLIQVQNKLNSLSGVNNTDVLNRTLLNLRKQLINNDNETANEDIKEAITFLLKLNLIEETTNPIIVKLVSDLGINEDMNITDVINTVNSSTLIDNLTKESIVKSIHDAITQKKRELALRANYIISTTQTSVEYTTESLLVILDGYGINFSLNDFTEKLVSAISEDDSLDDMTKLNLLKAFSLAL